MSSTTKLTAELDVQDKASGKIQQFGMSLGKLSAAVGIGTLAAGAFAKATGFVTDTIKGSIEAAENEQVATSKVNAILNTLTQTRKVSETVTSKYSATVGVSTEKQGELNVSIQKLKLQIEAKNVALGKLDSQLAKGTLTQAEYNVKVKQTKLDITELNGKIKSLGGQYSSTEVKTRSFTKTHEIAGLKMDDMKKAIDKAATAAMNLGFDDEDASIAMAKLLQVTGSTTQAQTALNNAMDLARFKGISLEDATQAVNMAMQGNVKILKQLGIEIPDNASKMELMGLIHQKVAGQAEAYGNTAAGAQEKFKVAIENLQETIGAKMLPMVTKFFTTVATFVNSDKLKGWLDTIGNLFNTYVSPIIRDFVIPAFNQLKAAIEPHIPLLKDIFKWIGIGVGATLVGAMIVLSGIIVLVAKGFDLIATAIEHVINWIKQAIGWFEKIISKVGDFAGSVGKVVGGGADKVGDFFKGIFKADGGPVSGGRPYIVGERGPELFVPSGNGSIVPNHKMGGGGATITVNFNNPVVRNEDDMRRLISEVQRSITESGRLVSIGAL